MLIIKIPTRERGIDWIAPWVDLLEDDETRIYLTLDESDDRQSEVPEVPDKYRDRVTPIVGRSESKIDAYNRDVDEITRRHPNWDVLIAGSDDMIPLVSGYDSRIRSALLDNYPDTDGTIWLPTEPQEAHWSRRFRRRIKRGSPEYLRRCIATLPIIGRRYYDRFGYVYHPSYRGFYCDNEYTEVARRLDRITFVDEDWIEHRHPTWVGLSPEDHDDLYRRTTAAHFRRDGRNFDRRRRRAFDLKKNRVGWSQ